MINSDLGRSAWQIEEQDEPYSLPIVVHLEKDSVADEREFYKAVALSMANLVVEPRWEESVAAWMAGRFRKVVRKARGATWNKATSAAENIHTVTSNGAEVAIFEPHKISSVPDHIRKLQVQGIDFPNVTPVNVEDVHSPDGLTVVVSINPELEMSSGKVAAQVAHATQLLFMKSEAEKVVKWIESGASFEVIEWENAPNTVEIVDAGLTEIPAGSFTVKSGWV